MFDKVCAYKPCGRAFKAFRSTAQYCCDQCRIGAHNARNNPYGKRRAKLIAKLGGKCEECGSSWKLYARRDPLTETVRLLCGTHNSALSRQLFRIRVPNATRGYAKGIYEAKKAFKKARKAEIARGPRLFDPL